MGFLEKRLSQPILLPANKIDPTASSGEYIPFTIRYSLSKDYVPPMLFFSRTHKPLSLSFLFSLTATQVAEFFETWIHTHLSVEEPIQEIPLFLHSSLLHGKGLNHNERMIEVKTDYDNQTRPRLEAWPYKRRQRHHYTTREHAFLAIKERYNDFMQVYIDPISASTYHRIEQENYSLTNSLSRVKNHLSRRRKSFFPLISPRQTKHTF